MHRALLLAATLAITAVLAGCVGSDSLDDQAKTPSGNYYPEASTERLPEAAEDLSHVISSDHEGKPALHAVPELHEGSYGIELVGYNPLTRPGEGDGPGAADSGYAAIDTFGTLVCVAHFAGTGGAGGGATIVDIADPTKPTVIASLASGMVNSDCQFTDDGKYLLLASYTGASLPISQILPPPVGDAGANGVNVYDVSDPSNPAFLFHDDQGAGGDGYHNVFTANIDGTNYVFQTYTGNILKIKDDGSGLEMVSKLQHSDHDLWVGHHPITGDWMVATGAEDGTAIFNLNDPSNPELLGIWEGSRDTRMTGWHRQWSLDNTVDGKAYMVVAGEECGNGDSLPYQVLDWTNPAYPELVGTWWIPGKPANPGIGGTGGAGQETPDHLCEMNSHEFEVFDGYVASGNYHAGVWVFDVGSPERAAEPATIGYYMPTENAQMNGGTFNTNFAWSPNTWGAYFDERGYIITADWHSGLYVLDIGIAQESE